MGVAVQEFNGVGFDAALLDSSFWDMATRDATAPNTRDRLQPHEEHKCTQIPIVNVVTSQTFAAVREGDSSLPAFHVSGANSRNDGSSHVGEPSSECRTSDAGHRLTQDTAHASVAQTASMQHAEAHAESGTGTAEQQLLRIRETARKSQQRYRQKQKTKLQESQDKVQQLTAQLSSLRMQKESLAMRNAELEKYVAVRQLEAAMEAVPEAAAAPAGSGASGGDAFPDTWWLDEETRQLTEQTLCLTGPLTVTIEPGPPLQLTWEQVACMPRPEFGGLVKQYVEALAGLLVQAKDDINSPAGRRLEQLLHEFARLRVIVALSDRERATCFEPSELLSEADTAPWGQALQAMRLTEQQRQMLIRMRRVVLINLGQLVAKRQRLSINLQVEQKQKAACCGDYLDSVPVLDQLREVLRQEHSMLARFSMAIWWRCLTPIQAVVLCVQVYPQTPNLLHLVNYVAWEEGQPSFEDLMEQGAARGTDAPLLPLESVTGVPQLNPTAPGSAPRAAAAVQWQSRSASQIAKSRQGSPWNKVFSGQGADAPILLLSSATGVPQLNPTATGIVSHGGVSQ